MTVDISVSDICHVLLDKQNTKTVNRSIFSWKTDVEIFDLCAGKSFKVREDDKDNIGVLN